MKDDEMKSFNIFANFIGIPEKLFYTGCPNDDCKKKVEDI